MEVRDGEMNRRLKGTCLNDAIFIDVVKHLVKNRGDDLLRTAGNGESEGSGVEITRVNLGGENGFSLEEIPFAFVMDQGNEVPDKVDQSAQ